MCYIICGWQDRIRTSLTLSIFILTTLALLSKLCFLGYWVRSEVNEDLPVTPGFSLHLYANSILALFALASIIVNIKMYFMIYFESSNKCTFNWVFQVNVFIVTSYIIFSILITLLYINFPAYSLAAPFALFKNENITIQHSEIQIPTWLDRFQTKYQCCGRNSYLEYKYEDEDDIKYNRIYKLPQSCCQTMKSDWNNDKTCNTDIFLMIPTAAQLIVHSQGCNGALEAAMELLTLITMCINWIITGLNITGMTAFSFHFKRNQYLHGGESSQTPELFGELSDPIIAQQQNSILDTLTFRNKPTTTTTTTATNVINNNNENNNNNNNSLNKKTIDYTVDGNISTLFNNSNINATNSLRRSRKPRHPQPVTHKPTSHPYDYFSRHGLSNVP